MYPLPVIALVACLTATTLAADAVDFVRDVRPIFQTHCNGCHGTEKQKSGLRLDIRSEALRGGDGYGPIVVAGSAEQSPLIELVTSDDQDSRMPPEGDGLSGAEIAILTAWVEQGAVWPEGVDLVELEDRTDHWSLKPLPAAPLSVQGPSPGTSGPASIDAFINQKLSDQGLRMSPPADRLTWLRRVYIDLIGLPPSPEQVQAFVNDRSPVAYLRVVDELLASPRYGERWAQHWLDVVRYADTDGFEVNTPRPNAWPYRDYVIEAFNVDVPYDRFIREQLAGDSISRDAATGFLVTAAALLPGQIGKDDVSKRLARQDSLAEIIINTSEAFLGLSIGCARCHDHKFDAISQRDYYSMQAFFSGVHYGERALESPPSKIFAGKFTAPEPTHLLLRGDPEQPLDEVPPAVPSTFGEASLSIDTPDQVRRQSLADWIASPHNVLTARVMVNRIWQWHFGIGLVETASDFGRSGTHPTHPELLDWMASEFIRSGWSIKQMHRRIVMSATYGQSNRVDSESQAKDADARLLWRFPSRRLEAETIRDSMLATSGRLNLKTGGPGFDLFQSRGGLSGFPPVESFAGDGLRRMIYAHKIRMEREAVFGAFDCPDAGQSAARRRQSTTPIQALNLFNSRFTIEEAQAFAERVRAESGDDLQQQIRRAYELAFGRGPDRVERRDAEPVVRKHGLATLCRVLFNSNEFLFLP